MWSEVSNDDPVRNCATAGCINLSKWRLEAGGVWSEYCGDCKAKIEQINEPTRGREKCEPSCTVCDSYADENQRLFDRAETAERKLAEERERCARIADSHAANFPGIMGVSMAKNIADDIRFAPASCMAAK